MRILVVEDDAIIAMMIQHSLARAGHEVVDPVPSVARALDLAQDEHVDLAMLDIDLGRGGNGVDLARRLHERHGIVSLFASGSDREARRASDVALGLLSKPFGPQELLQAVEAAGALLAGSQPAYMPRAMELFEAHGAPRVPLSPFNHT